MSSHGWTDRLAASPAADDPGGRVVVVSAHPDDDVIGLGAWMADQIDRDIAFVVATDGEASHPDSPTVSPDDLRRIRRRELDAALAALGHADPHVTHLGLPDSDLAGHEDRLVAALVPLLGGAALVVTPYEHDGHPDHDAVGRAVLAAAPADATVWRYPVWSWEWEPPADDDPRLHRTRSVASTGPARARKRLALQTFRSQVEPLSDHPADRVVVPESLLRRAGEAPEVVFA